MGLGIGLSRGAGVGVNIRIRNRIRNRNRHRNRSRINDLGIEIAIRKVCGQHTQITKHVCTSADELGIRK